MQKESADVPFQCKLSGIDK